MKYYCKKCKMELYSPEKEDPVYHCPICFTRLSSIPDHETVVSWEERTGKKYPGTAPIFQRLVASDCEPYWYATNYKFAQPDKVPIVATEAGAPPDDWRPV